MSPHKLRSGRLVCSSSRMCTFSRAVCTTVGEHIAVVVGPCAGTCTPSVVRAGLRLRAGISAGPLDTVGVAVLRGATWVISLRGSPFAGEEYAPEDEGSICGLLFVGKGYCPESGKDIVCGPSVALEQTLVYFARRTKGTMWPPCPSCAHSRARKG